MKSSDQASEVFVARYEARLAIEKLPVNRTVLVGDESFNGWPIWALPPWYGEKVESKPLSPEIVAAGEERARELRHYAARLEVLDGRNLGGWH